MIIPLIIYQEAITLAAGSARFLLTDAVVMEMNAGGPLIFAIALDLSGIKRYPAGNLLPSIFMAMGLVWTLSVSL